jgi:hypothetical protein
MAFSNSRLTDARESTFVDIGRDHNHDTTIHNLTINVTNFSLWGSGRTSNHLRSAQESFSPRRVLEPKYQFEANSVDEIASRLIIEIVQALMSSGFSDYYQPMKLELELLQQTIFLTGLAKQSYQDTPLGPNLASAINQEIERGCIELQELLDTINRYRHGLNSTYIGYVWGHVLWGGEAADRLASLRLRLSVFQQSLGRCLRALDS